MLTLDRERYGEAPTSAYLAHAYDAATMLFRAINEVAVGDGDTLYIGRAKLREALAGVAGFRCIVSGVSSGSSPATSSATAAPAAYK